MIALPAEQSHDQKQALTREYVQAEFGSKVMIADVGYHDFDSHNPHAHIMLTMRLMNEESFGKKTRQWNRRDAVIAYRADWADYANRALEQAGHDVRIDHRSLKDQCIEREPQSHLGAQVMEMEARGIQTRVGDESRRISKVNRDIERQQARGKKLAEQIEVEQKAELTSAQLEPSSSQAPSPEPQKEPRQSQSPEPEPRHQPSVSSKRAPTRQKDRKRDRGIEI